MPIKMYIGVSNEMERLHSRRKEFDILLYPSVHMEFQRNQVYYGLLYLKERGEFNISEEELKGFNKTGSDEVLYEFVYSLTEEEKVRHNLR